IMGLSFISEGAIPFAAQDPLRVIPSCIAGSAVAGGLSMLLGCTLRAPHGGIFVLPTIGNPIGYLAAVAAGSAVGCVILAALKKNV
ncbi:MAG: PTS fructose transporter subunit IIC, partial [[Clostridium] symbiosum]|nr:PTS fructose transporter subunit IIC [[Clostridium] symbiosum]